MATISTKGLGGAQFARFLPLAENVAADPRMRDITAVVEVADNDSARFHQIFGEGRYREDMSGWMPIVGEFGGMSVSLSLRFATLDGLRIALWHATSVVVHYDMIERWLQANLSVRPGLRIAAETLLSIPDFKAWVDNMPVEA